MAMALSGNSTMAAPFSSCSSACNPWRALRWGVLMLLFLLLLLSLRARAWLDLLQEDDLWRQHNKPLLHASEQVHTLREHEGMSHHPKMRMGVSSITAFSSPSPPAASIKQPGSRPPECHRACPGCHGECTARPLYVYGSHSVAQHAVWSCACVF